MKRLAATLVALAVLASLPSRADVTSGAVEMLAGLAPLRGVALNAAAIEDRVVVVTFFASWCPPCHAEFRHLKALKSEFGERITVVAVNYFEDFGGLSNPAKLEAFLIRHKPNFYVLAGTPEIGHAFDDVDRIPSLFIFDRKGALAWRFRHARAADKTHVDKDELTNIVQKLL